MQNLIIKEPASVKSAREFFKYCRETCIKYGIDFNYLVKCAEEFRYDYAAYDRVLHDVIDEAVPSIVKQLEKKTVLTDQILNLNIRNIGNMLDAIFSFSNSTRFVFECPCQGDKDFFSVYDLPEHIDRYDFLDVMDEMPDALLDIKTKSGYVNMVFRLVRANYTMDYRDAKDLPVFNLTCLVSHDNTSIVTAQYTIVKGLFPKMLLDPAGTILHCAHGQKCPRCVKVQVKEKLLSGSSELMHEYCFMTQKKMEEFACEAAIFNPYKILKIFAYVWDMYSHRHTLERKNSTRRKHYTQNRVSTITHDTSGKVRVLDVNQYYHYEREHKEWQGGHHKSPIQHERREHERRIFNKDGTLKKVVKVKSSVVNKGGEIGLYKVKADKQSTELDDMNLF